MSTVLCNSSHVDVVSNIVSVLRNIATRLVQITTSHFNSNPNKTNTLHDVTTHRKSPIYLKTVRGNTWLHTRTLQQFWPRYWWKYPKLTEPTIHNQHISHNKRFTFPHNPHSQAAMTYLLPHNYPRYFPNHFLIPGLWSWRDGWKWHQSWVIQPILHWWLYLPCHTVWNGTPFPRAAISKACEEQAHLSAIILAGLPWQELRHTLIILLMGDIKLLHVTSGTSSRSSVSVKLASAELPCDYWIFMQRISNIY